jgi:haloacetate dehalogenase
MCEDYRAAASVDLDHDRASRAAGEQVRCDLFVLHGERSVVGRMFDAPALWRARCSGRVDAATLPCGHFLPEEQPDATAALLAGFFDPGSPGGSVSLAPPQDAVTEP